MGASPDTVVPTTKSAVKFVCSYGGKILPRHPDGKLRYVGGEIRVLAVDRSTSFVDLLLKLEALSGSLVNLRCQLPKEDLDTLVSVTSDEDLANIIKEYDLAATEAGSRLKIRAFLFPAKPVKKVSPPPCSMAAKGKYLYKPAVCRVAAERFVQPIQRSATQTLIRYPVCFERLSGRSQLSYSHSAANATRTRMVHNGRLQRSY